ncbi:MAG: transglycosylase SLT domain-containing protein, partial [Clostridia bacterium]|nr:transglycosylase SLT domain-containing protein [Clostridia bacterium]
EEYKEELHYSYDTGMLYDPETNIKYGTYKLSKIYLKVGTWRAVYAAMSAGEDTVLGWLEDDRYSEKSELAKTKLTVIPDKEAELFTKRLEETAEKYKTLYYED